MAIVPEPAALDTIIVGAGAAGSLLAARLAEAGQNIVVLDAGPERRLSQLYSSQIWARRLKWSGAPVEEAGNHQISHAFNAGSGTGGSALHHYGVWLRLHEKDFSVASDHGVGKDWPIRYADLRAHYDRVQTEVGISGDAAKEIARPAGAPYPMPPLPVFAQGRVMARGFAKLGLQTAPLPLAINRVPYQGRAACIYDGWCDAGCPIGALGNPLVTYIPRARAAGAVFRHECAVTRVLREPAKRGRVRISGVEFMEAGERKTLRAKRVIVAAFTVQTTRILLNSAAHGRPAPGNAHDQLGRYLAAHPAGTVFGLFKDETLPHQGVSGGQLLCHHNYDDKAYFDGAFGSHQWLIAHAIKPHDLLGYATSRPDVIGADLKPWLKRAARHLGNMTLVAEDISLPNNRITLSDKRDSHGVPLARAEHNLTDKTLALWDQGIAQGQEILRAAGASEVWHGPRVAMHIMGGTVMGDDERGSVTDGYGRVHDTSNLYVAGPSLFPSSGAVNPTFTLSALASRLADFLITATGE